MAEFDTWFPAAAKQALASPRLRLVLFPSSGTMEALFTQKCRGEDRKMGPNALMAWAAKENVEILSVQLPGRGKRHKEAFSSSCLALAAQLAPVLAPRLEGCPYAVVGHSMGAWAAYFTIVELLRTAPSLPPPTLFVPACFPAPDLAVGAARPWTPCRGLSEAAFKDECRGWAINEAVLTTPHIWQSYHEMIRSDFILFDECLPVEPAKLPCPVAACWAVEDTRVTESLALGWQRFVPEGHFHALPPTPGHHLFLLDDALKATWFNHALIPLLTQRAFTAPDMAPPPPPPPAEPAALADATASLKVEPAWPLRILCLHGFGGSEAILSKQTERLRLLVDAEVAAAGGKIEWHFLTSPAEVNWDPDAFEARLVTSFFPEGPHRQWMRRVSAGSGPTILSDASGALAAAAAGQAYADWQGPLEFAVNHLQQQASPYHGVLGFSQGSNLATLLVASLEAGAPINHPPFSFAVPMCGSSFGWREQWASASNVLPHWPTAPLFDKPLATPSLHLIATGDPLKPASEALAQLFDHPTVVPFPSGHKPPTQKAAASALAAFLVAAVQGNRAPL